MKEDDMVQIINWIDRLILDPDNEANIKQVGNEVAGATQKPSRCSPETSDQVRY